MAITMTRRGARSFHGYWKTEMRSPVVSNSRFSNTISITATGVQDFCTKARHDYQIVLTSEYVEELRRQLFASGVA